MDLKTLRDALGLSQAELDRLAGLARGTTSDIESGRNQNPSVGVCIELVRALKERGARGVTVEALFGKVLAS